MEAHNDSAIESDHPVAPDSIPHRPRDVDAKEYHDLTALSRVSAAVSGLRDLDAILEVALDNVISIVDGTVGGVLLLDEQTQMLSYRVHRGLSAKYAEEMHLRMGEGIAGMVAQSGKSVLLGDVSSDPRVARPDLVRTEGLRALISVPLRVEDTVVGVLNVASAVPRKFTTRDMHLLHSIGDQLGVAIGQTRLQERLRRARDRYRQLARQALMAQEDERRRIARELHDETSQTLSGLALNLQALVDMAEMSGSQSDDFKEGLKKARTLAVQIGTEVNRLMKELRPALLDTLGLVPAVRQYAESTLSSTGIYVTVDVKGTIEHLPQEVETELFRFMQGAIGNIAVHSQAKNAVITFEYKPDELHLFINDDGQGFDVSQLTGIEESGRGRGLFSMKERIALLGGRCSVKSTPDQGTTVTAKIPVIRSKVDEED